MSLFIPDNRPWGTCLTDLQLPKRRAKKPPQVMPAVNNAVIRRVVAFAAKVAEPILRKEPEKPPRKRHRKSNWKPVEHRRPSGVQGPPRPPHIIAPSHTKEARKKYQDNWYAVHSPEERSAEWRKTHAQRDQLRRKAYYKAYYLFYKKEDGDASRMA